MLKSYLVKILILGYKLLRIAESYLHIQKAFQSNRQRCINYQTLPPVFLIILIIFHKEI